MAIELPKATQAAAVGSIERWFSENTDERIGNMQAAALLDFFLREIPIEPIWVCPLRQRDPSVEWPLYTFTPGTQYVNFGFWSAVDLAPGEADGTHNRLIEAKVGELGGRKSLYSTSFYSAEEFWRLYNGPVYDIVKKSYDPGGRLLDLYAKCVGRQ